MTEMVPASQPQRVEIRVGGKTRFASLCYDLELEQEDGVVSFSASLQPRMVTAPPAASHRFGDDARDGEELIQRVHSGRRDVRVPISAAGDSSTVAKKKAAKQPTKAAERKPRDHSVRITGAVGDSQVLAKKRAAAAAAEQQDAERFQPERFEPEGVAP